MGKQDKGLVCFNNRPMVSYSLDAMAQVADKIIISANRNLLLYQEFNTQVLVDQDNAFNGPLAGILVALNYLSDYPVILVAPCDCPLFGSEQLQKLLDMREKNNVEIAVATTGFTFQPLFLALTSTLKNSLENYLLRGNRKVVSWLNLHTMVKVDFTGQEEKFFNVNSLDDLANLQRTFSKTDEKKADTTLYRHY